MSLRVWSQGTPHTEDVTGGYPSARISRVVPVDGVRSLENPSVRVSNYLDSTDPQESPLWDPRGRVPLFHPTPVRVSMLKNSRRSRKWGPFSLIPSSKDQV